MNRSTPHHHPVWQSTRRRPAIPLHWRPWLCERGSLTQQLRIACQGEFEVELLKLYWDLPSRSEALRLGIPFRQRTLIREVHLCGYGEPWVFARSIIPAATLQGDDRRLLLLGNRSLGSLLFSDPSIRRGQIEVTRLSHQQQTCWARRSVFRLQQGPILVMETFLPSMASIAYPSLKDSHYA